MVGSGSAQSASAASHFSATATATAAQQELVLVMDFGSQTAQLIARRVREQNVFCQVVRHDLSAQRIRELNPKGIILSGGPASVYSPGAPTIDPAIYELKIPILGICYGMQITCQTLGGKIPPVSRSRVWPRSMYSIGRKPAVRWYSENLQRPG
jgi:GMP synthase (glutamine-hydrolysing)